MHKSEPTIVLCGGGTAGHIMPAIAVAKELKSRLPKSKLIYIIDKNSKFEGLVEDTNLFDKKFSIYSGKLRRYHGESWLKKVFDIKTNFLNFRDSFYVVFGIIQSLYLLKKIKPDIIFIKGGFVGVPVGLGGALYKIPYITHDSDSVPGLANRIISRWAIAHAVGMPEEMYNYPKNKTFFVGIPTAEHYDLVSEAIKHKARSQIGIDKNAKMVLVTGGSIGAIRLNKAFAGGVVELCEMFDNLYIEHQTGSKDRHDYYANLPKSIKSRIKAYKFLDNLYQHSSACDIVIARAGATSIAEFAQQGLACILVPNPQLTNGHQSKNAEVLAQAKAVEVVTEEQIQQDPKILNKKIINLLKNDSLRAELKSNIRKFAKPNATKELCDLLLKNLEK